MGTQADADLPASTHSPEERLSKITCRYSGDSSSSGSVHSACRYLHRAQTVLNLNDQRSFTYLQLTWSMLLSSQSAI